MKTRNILITLPCEPPPLPPGFELGYYALMQEEKEERKFKKHELESAAMEWIYQGTARVSLTCVAFGYINNSEYAISTVWDDNAESWETTWMDFSNGFPFDFGAFKEAKQNER